MPLGRKGAALTAFGEIVELFFGAPAPLSGSEEGVKLGESTFKCFLLLLLLLLMLSRE
jgi:hypothetical protein